MFYASVPDYYRNKWKREVLKVREHAGTFWLWADPGLLSWRFEIRWLFSPVNTGARRPGDLWGVDSKGNLLIVENKLQGRGDPFQDFIGFLEDCGEPGITAHELGAQFSRLNQPICEVPIDGCCKVVPLGMSL